MSDNLKTADYGALLTELKARIHAAQYAALRAVNKELLALYWDIGKLIEERQETEGWGKAVVERLSADLRAEFGQKSGFSVQNLWYMRKFYLRATARFGWTRRVLEHQIDNQTYEKYLLNQTSFDRVLNEQVKLPDENDAIGIIICKSKKKTVVESALKTATQPIGVATYSLTQHLPAAYQHLLPNEDEIRDRLQGWLGLGTT